MPLVDVKVKNLVVDCVCGGSFFVNETDCRKQLERIYTCNNLHLKAGKEERCTAQYSFITLLKIMHITHYWHAADKDTEARAENVTI